MSVSNYESRQGFLKCGVDKVFAFITDFRNFGKLVENNNVANWQADKESCGFNFAMLGAVSVKLSEKEQSSKVVYQGTGAGNIDFTITVLLDDNGTESSKISVNLSAYFNPIMKMMADKPVKMFLDKLISEVENFNEWDNVT
jgi:carbon monoxide dehydrogenase subunit G